MHTFIIVISLSSVMGAQVSYFGPARPFKDQADCERALQKAESAVAGIIGRDPDSLSLFGQVSGPLTRGYFVSDGWCLAAGAAP